MRDRDIVDSEERVQREREREREREESQKLSYRTCEDSYI